MIQGYRTSYTAQPAVNYGKSMFDENPEYFFAHLRESERSEEAPKKNRTVRLANCLNIFSIKDIQLSNTMIKFHFKDTIVFIVHVRGCYTSKMNL